MTLQYSHTSTSLNITTTNFAITQMAGYTGTEVLSPSGYNAISSVCKKHDVESTLL